MLKKLQRRFVLFVAIISFVVLGCISAIASVVNYSNIMKNSDGVIELISSNGYAFPENFKPKPNEFSSEIANTARFFTVSIENGKVSKLNLSNIRQLPPEEVMQLVETAFEDEDMVGRIGNFKYMLIEEEIIFLDIEEQMRIFQSFMTYLMIVIFVAFVGILLFSAMVSKRVVYPMVESSLKQKRFITDVSHELKTPLAIIKANNELLEMESADVECTTSISEQISRLASLVDSLISLSRLEEKDDLLKTEFSLSESTREVVLAFAPAIERKNINLELQVENNVSFEGAEEEIRKLLGIILENAIKYSPEKGKIVVNLQGERKILSIKNQCENTKKGDCSDWFDRFFREDLSRSSAGYGIGLSIARNICELHKIKISARKEEFVEIRLEF